MTTEGFFSAVEHRDDPSVVLVRARCAGDIRALCLRTGRSPAEAEQNLSADYEWRLEMPREEWEETLAGFAADIDYDNFKNAVKSLPHKNAYGRVWAVLLQLQYPEVLDESDDSQTTVFDFLGDYDDAA
jgi:hypothetical protein